MNLPQTAMRMLLGTRLPITSGSLTAGGAAGEVIIRRDAWGVPHIRAGEDRDAWYGLGFCQGQDRAFQLESQLRVVRGTLAELVGKEALPVDRLSRRIGFVPAAQRQLEASSAGLRAMLDAFAAGVNDGATVGTAKPAHELALLRSSFTPWTARDVLGYLQLVSFLLATNWDVELARLKILSLDGPEALADLDPTYPEWQPVTTPPGAIAGPALDRLREEAAALTAVAGGGGASNNWSLAASRTATGRPILANDPHLAPALPPHWYLAHLSTPEWSVAGGFFVGLPSVPVGHNGVAAWGVTVGMTDNTDLFLEEVGSDGRSVRQGSDFVPCEVRVERIAVKGGPDVVEEVLVTPRGPMIGPAMEGEVGAVSIRAVWLDPLPVEGLLTLPRVGSFDEFRAALAGWPALPLNVAYADRSGTIGWQLMGMAPRRRKGFGAIPLAGWDPEAGWEEEMVPDQEMPFALNPEGGFVATANNKATQGDTGPFLTVDWIDGYRLARIVEVLQSRDDWTLAGATALQTDVQSLPWREMRDIVLSVPDRDGLTRQALELLRGWDGKVAARSPAAAVFELFVAEMSRRVAEARAPNSYRYVLGQGFHPMSTHTPFGVRRVGHLVRLLRVRPPGWFSDPWEEEMADALCTVVRRLRATRGPDVATWAWGDLRTLTLKHPFGQRKPFDRVFNLGPIPWGGDANTPAQASVDPLDPTRNPDFIASMRMVVDVGEWENSRFILPGGQSGNPLSPHYADQLPLWQRGEGIPIPWSEVSVEEATRKVLRLYPAHQA